jgi:hypothetical protein
VTYNGLVVLSDQHCVGLCTRVGFVLLIHVWTTPLRTQSAVRPVSHTVFSPRSLSNPGLRPDDSGRRNSSGTMRFIDHSSTSETLRARLPGLSVLRIEGRASQRSCVVPTAMYVLHRHDANVYDGKKSTYELGKKMQADALYRDKRRLVKSDCCRTVSGLAR